MKSLRKLRGEVVYTLQKNQVIYSEKTDDDAKDSLTIVLDHHTHSSKIKKIITTLKAKRLNCQCSFSPDSWEFFLRVSAQ